MDGPRDCHTEWTKSEREKQILYINTYGIWKNVTDELVCKAEIDRCREQTYGHQGRKAGRWWWCDELGDWDWDIYTNMYKIDN